MMDQYFIRQQSFSTACGPVAGGNEHSASTQHESNKHQIISASHSQSGSLSETMLQAQSALMPSSYHEMVEQRHHENQCVVLSNDYNRNEPHIIQAPLNYNCINHCETQKEIQQIQERAINEHKSNELQKEASAKSDDAIDSITELQSLYVPHHTDETNVTFPHPKRRFLEKLEAAVAYLENPAVETIQGEVITTESNASIEVSEPPLVKKQLHSGHVSEGSNEEVTEYGKVNLNNVKTVCQSIILQDDQTLNKVTQAQDKTKKETASENSEVYLQSGNKRKCVILQEEKLDSCLNQCQEADTNLPIKLRLRSMQSSETPKPTETSYKMFKNEWLKKHTWLYYDGNQMFCQICMKHKPDSVNIFISGNTVYSPESLESHANSNEHTIAWKLHCDKPRCGCITQFSDNSHSTLNKEKFLLQNILQHFQWLNYNKSIGVLTCDVCSQVSESSFNISLDFSLMLEDILAHRNSPKHQDAEKYEMLAWETLYDSGQGKVDDQLLDTLTNRQTIYSNSKNHGLQSKSILNTKCIENQAPRSCRSNRRKGRKPHRYDQDSSAEFSTSYDLIPELLKICEQSKINQNSDIKIEESDYNINKHSLSLIQKNEKYQKMTVKNINPWKVHPELNNTSSPTGKILVSKFKFKPTFGKFKRCWLKEFPWLEYRRKANVMLCKVCRQHGKHNSFYKGCRMFQRTSLIAHEKLKMHRLANEFEKIKTEQSSAHADSEKATDKQCEHSSLKPVTSDEHSSLQVLVEEPKFTTEVLSFEETRSRGRNVNLQRQMKQSSSQEEQEDADGLSIIPPYNPDYLENTAVTNILANTGLLTSTVPQNHASNENILCPDNQQQSKNISTNNEVEVVSESLKNVNCDEEFEGQSSECLTHGSTCRSFSEHEKNLTESDYAYETSATKHFVTSEQVLKSPKKCEPDKSLKSSKEKTRVRHFQPQWNKEHPWLVYDETQNKMFCKVCIKYKLISTFTTGNSSFRIGTVRSHEGSILHQKATQFEFMEEFNH